MEYVYSFIIKKNLREPFIPDGSQGDVSLCGMLYTVGQVSLRQYTGELDLFKGQKNDDKGSFGYVSPSLSAVHLKPSPE